MWGSVCLVIHKVRDSYNCRYCDPMIHRINTQTECAHLHWRIFIKQISFVLIQHCISFSWIQIELNGQNAIYSKSLEAFLLIKEYYNLPCHFKINQISDRNLIARKGLCTFLLSPGLFPNYNSSIKTSNMCVSPGQFYQEL